MHHLFIVGIALVVQSQCLIGVLADIGLVEDTQHLVKPVVDLSVQPGYLNNDTVVCQAFHKGVGQALRHLFAVVIV